eukprot:6209252-Pleurochrysis_carterae.AAC.1
MINVSACASNDGSRSVVCPLNVITAAATVSRLSDQTTPEIQMIKYDWLRPEPTPLPGLGGQTRSIRILHVVSDYLVFNAVVG